MLNFMRPDAREVVLARVEEHALEELRGGVERRRIARTQLAVDLDQRFVLRLDGVLLERGGDHRADVVALGEEHFELVDAGFDERGREWSAVSSLLASISTSPVVMSTTSAAT